MTAVQGQVAEAGHRFPTTVGLFTYPGAAGSRRAALRRRTWCRSGRTSVQHLRAGPRRSRRRFTTRDFSRTRSSCPTVLIPKVHRERSNDLQDPSSKMSKSGRLGRWPESACLDDPKAVGHKKDSLRAVTDSEREVGATNPPRQQKPGFPTCLTHSRSAVTGHRRRQSLVRGLRRGAATGDLKARQPRIAVVEFVHAPSRHAVGRTAFPISCRARIGARGRRTGVAKGRVRERTLQAGCMTGLGFLSATARDALGGGLRWTAPAEPGKYKAKPGQNPGFLDRLSGAVSAGSTT